MYKQDFIKKEEDGVYAAAIINDENFIFSFKLEKDDGKAILFGKITPIMYYVPSEKKEISVAPLVIELEVFDCVNDLLMKNHQNKDLILELIEKQQLNDFLTKTTTKYDDNSTVKYNVSMSTLDLTNINKISPKRKFKK